MPAEELAKLKAAMRGQRVRVSVAAEGDGVNVSISLPESLLKQIQNRMKAKAEEAQ